MNRLSLASGLVVIASLAACTAAQPTRYDEAFGESVRQARAMQVIDPNAGRSAESVTGLDARAARAAIDLYHESFKTPPRSFEVIGSSGGGR